MSKQVFLTGQTRLASIRSIAGREVRARDSLVARPARPGTTSNSVGLGQAIRATRRWRKWRSICLSEIGDGGQPLSTLARPLAQCFHANLTELECGQNSLGELTSAQLVESLSCSTASLQRLAMPNTGFGLRAAGALGQALWPKRGAAQLRSLDCPLGLDPARDDVGLAEDGGTVGCRSREVHQAMSARGPGDASITFLSGIPENVKDEVVRSMCPAWEQGLSQREFFEIVRDIWIKQLDIQWNKEVMRLIRTSAQEDLRIVMMKFDPTRTKDGNVAARLNSFLMLGQNLHNATEVGLAHQPSAPGGTLHLLGARMFSA
eukprot:g16720.t1